MTSTLRNKPVEQLSEADAASELGLLADEMAAYDRLYYQEDAPSVSDAEYDALKQRNLAIEARFPHLKRADPLGRRIGEIREDHPQGADALARQRLHGRGGE